ncbi:hypothetical protein RISK_004078 [Rhodopirellula islandica]|uniref:Uncharacterized protein n=1 Tax=Rhodopirellula islandica TaxID=595434 RepID=A0A0J1BAZ4_RHOIS|nr:hypothetical protein RISK_004078 [Rhodopirellula islandica]
MQTAVGSRGRWFCAMHGVRGGWRVVWGEVLAGWNVGLVWMLSW